MRIFTSLRYGLMGVCLMGLAVDCLWSQCPFQVQVLHGSGTEQVLCTSVTVTSEGSVGINSFPPCFYSPYIIGQVASGSYTFDFSVPVAGVKINVQTLDAHQEEEMALEVNDVFYPITMPGVNSGCEPPASISPTGTIWCNDPAGFCAWRDIYVPGPINKLKISNNWLAAFPAGIAVDLFICCTICETSAGELLPNNLNLCPGEMATIPPAQQTHLEADDVLRYILFSNPGDTLGSILAVSDVPTFSFDPVSMTMGTTYYIAAVAANNLGGSFDPDDLCLHISNAVEVAWWPLPSVTFSIDEECITPNNCFEVQAVFTGTPPFLLTGQAVSGTNVVSAFAGDYLSDWLITVCLPSNTPLGPLTVQATVLSDAHCTCD